MTRAVVALLVVVVACAPIAAIAPEAPDSHGCHPDTEHWCPAEAGCCLQHFTCGGDIGCPSGSCCDDEPFPSLGMGAESRMQPMRHP
jgi:hypothetical protein